MRIVTTIEEGQRTLEHELDRLENHYLVLTIIGAVMLGLGLLI
jgi:hypothetical protein